VRDLDDDVVHNPFDQGLKTLAQRFGSLVRNILETVDRRGLKRRFLMKHRRDVERFRKSLDSSEPHSEVEDKYRKRLLKYWSKMFVFLEYDGVPWNNTIAEHAIKRFAKYRRNADGRFTEQSLKDYLSLASVLETCESNAVNPLRFMLSGETNLGAILGGTSLRKHPRSPNL